MASDYYTGSNVRIGVGINGVAAGITFDEAVGAFDCMKVVTGGAVKIDHSCGHLEVDEMDVDPEFVVAGGELHLISCDVVMSYSFREKIFHLWTGGTMGTVGAGPYVHTPAVVDKLLNGGFFVEYTKQSAQANEIIRETYANFVVTGIAVKASPEGYALLSFQGIATGKARATTQAALTTVNTTEPLRWKELETSLDGTTTFRTGDVYFDLGAILAEGEFEHASTTPETQDGNWRKGQRGVAWGGVVNMNDATHALSTDPTANWTGANYLKWDNGAAAGANRVFEIIFGTSYHDGNISKAHGNWGRQPHPLKMKVLDGATARVEVNFTNGRVTIPA